MTVEDPWGEYPEPGEDTREPEPSWMNIEMLYEDAVILLGFLKEYLSEMEGQDVLDVELQTVLSDAIVCIEMSLNDSVPDEENDRFTGYDDHLATEP